MLFDSSSTFVDLRDPLRVVTFPPGEQMSVRMTDLPGGDYALVVYHDENGNGRLDKNFIGIPREPLGFSNRYRPKGPPTFSRAAFRLEYDETKSVDVSLHSVFGKSGMVGLGLGAISRTSPYRGAKTWDVLPIPAISYIGERLQIMGLTARCGITDWGDVALAATARYRFGAYDEDDSDYLEGMGDRDDTLLGGLALQVKLPEGFKLSTGYEHDLLDRTGGGIGRLGVEKSFQQGSLTVSPQLALNWLTDKLADYEYGVPADRARAGRPAYHPGDAVTVEAGVSLLRELNADWRFILTGSVAFLPETIRDSPLVDRSQVFTSFIAITRQF
jgi:outer membrane protein